jgi:hypothetical protein
MPRTASTRKLLFAKKEIVDRKTLLYQSLRLSEIALSAAPGEARLRSKTIHHKGRKGFHEEHVPLM